MSPPSTSDTDGDGRPPSRRAVLAALATTGCLGLRPSDARDRSPRSTPTGTTPSPTDTGTTPPPNVGDEPVRLSVHNDTDEPRELRIRVGEGGAGFDEVLTVNDGVAQLVSEFPTTTDHDVRVEDRTGDRSATDRWTVRGALRDLRIVLEPDEIRFVQSATCDPTCPPVSVDGGEAVSLPYRRPDAEETFSSAGIRVTSEYDSAETVLRLVVRDGDVTILDQGYRLAADRRLWLPAILATKGWYAVEATVGDETTTYDWHVAGNWPRAHVHVDGRGVPRVGCGTDPQPLVLVNERGEDVQVDLRLEKRGEAVWTGPVGLGAGSTLSLTPVDLGDDLTVTASVDGETAAGKYVTCDCRGGRTTVTVGDGVAVEDEIAVCV